MIFVDTDLEYNVRNKLYLKHIRRISLVNLTIIKNVLNNYI